MLAIVNRVAAAYFAARQDIDEAAVADGPRLQTDHSAESNPALPHRPARHPHQPVRTAELTVAHASGPVKVARFVEELDECRSIQHHGPLACRSMQPEH